MKEYINESYEDDYGVALDSKGREIHKGDWVVWTDPDGGRKTKYEVYEEPTEDMVKLSNKYGECEALPEECTLVKK